MIELRRAYVRGASVSSARACGLGAFPPTFLQYVLDFTVVKARLPSSGSHIVWVQDLHGMVGLFSWHLGVLGGATGRMWP